MAKIKIKKVSLPKYKTRAALKSILKSGASSILSNMKKRAGNVAKPTRVNKIRFKKTINR